jgi:hypothetical protein
VILLFPSAHLARIAEYDHILLLGGGKCWVQEKQRDAFIFFFSLTPNCHFCRFVLFFAEFFCFQH